VADIKEEQAKAITPIENWFSLVESPIEDSL
jgi:hypothetical protein